MGDDESRIGSSPLPGPIAVVVAVNSQSYEWNVRIPDRLRGFSFISIRRSAPSYFNFEVDRTRVYREVFIESLKTVVTTPDVLGVARDVQFYSNCLNSKMRKD